MIFNFSLYTMSLLATLVVYFGMELEELSRWKPLENGKVYHC